jgi:hypothetical protein
VECAKILHLDDANANQVPQCPELGMDDFVLTKVERRFDDEWHLGLRDSNDHLLWDKVRMHAPSSHEVLPAVLGRRRLVHLGAGVPEDTLGDRD